MKDKVTLFSMMREEPTEILKMRLAALEQLPHNVYSSDWVMESFDARDERGFGVLTNMATDNVAICQYGMLTTFEQLSLEQVDAGIVVCDLFDAVAQYNLSNYWKKLSLLHQAFTNSGVFVYVPSGESVEVTCYFVQDNSVDEVMIKSVFVLTEEGASVSFKHVDLSFGEKKNVASVEVVKINAIT